MKKPEFAIRLAAKGSRSPAEAADTIDGVVHGILKRIRSGRRASLPGLGSFTPGEVSSFQFLKEPDRRRG